MNSVEILQQFYLLKKEKIKELLMITQRAWEITLTEDKEQLEQIFQARQTIMNDVDQIINKIKILEKEVDGKTIRTYKDDIQNLLGQVIKLDEQMKDTLGEDMGRLKHKIKDLQRKKAVKKAYYPQKFQKFGYFVDNKK